MAYNKTVPNENNLVRTASGDVAAMRENFVQLAPIIESGLHGLSGVDAPSPADGQYLRFDTGSLSWVASGELDEFVKSAGDVMSGSLVLHQPGTGDATETTDGALKTFDLMIRHSEIVNHPHMALHGATDFNGRAPRIYGLRARGTSAAPTAVSGGEDCLLFFGHGFDGVEYSTVAGFSAQADGPASPGDTPGRVVFFAVGVSGTVLHTHMVMKGTGVVGIGSGIGNEFEPEDTLHVIGGVLAASGAFSGALTAGGQPVATSDPSFMLVAFSGGTSAFDLSNFATDDVPVPYNTVVETSGNGWALNATSGEVTIPSGVTHVDVLAHFDMATLTGDNKSLSGNVFVNGSRVRNIAGYLIDPIMGFRARTGIPNAGDMKAVRIPVSGGDLVRVQINEAASTESLEGVGNWMLVKDSTATVRS